MGRTASTLAESESLPGTPQSQISRSRLGYSEEAVTTIYLIGFPEDFRERELRNLFAFADGFEGCSLKNSSRDESCHSPFLETPNSTAFESNQPKTTSSSSSPTQRSRRKRSETQEINSFSDDFARIESPSNDGYIGEFDPKRSSIVFNLASNDQKFTIDSPSSLTNRLTKPELTCSAQQTLFHKSFTPVVAGLVKQQVNRSQIIGFAKFKSVQEAQDACNILNGRVLDSHSTNILRVEMAKKNLHLGSVRSKSQSLPILNASQSNNSVQSSSSFSLPSFNIAMRPVEPKLNPVARSFELQDPADYLKSGFRKSTDDGNFKSYPFSLQLESSLMNSRINSIFKTENIYSEGLERESKIEKTYQASEGFEELPLDEASVLCKHLNKFNAVSTTNLFTPIKARRASLPTAYLADLLDIPAKLKSSSLNTFDNFDWMSRPFEHLTPGVGRPLLTDKRQSSSIFLPMTAHSKDNKFSDQLSDDECVPSVEKQSETPTEDNQKISKMKLNGMIDRKAESITPKIDLNCLGSSSGRSSLEDNRAFNSPNKREIKSYSINKQVKSPLKTGMAPQINSIPFYLAENPPCNTLYVGNLPPSVCEMELRSLFGETIGYRRLILKSKAGGSPMCFVEFQDIQTATIAMESLYGTLLSSSTKGGIRLSYSKNPLGIRATSMSNSTSTTSLVTSQSHINEPLAFSNCNNTFAPHEPGKMLIGGSLYAELFAPQNFVDPAENEGIYSPRALSSQTCTSNFYYQKPILEREISDFSVGFGNSDSKETLKYATLTCNCLFDQKGR